jgi:hypothetical protein
MKIIVIDRRATCVAGAPTGLLKLIPSLVRFPQ